MKLSTEILASVLVRVPGIEPGSIAWEAIILPLNHTRILKLFYQADYSVDSPTLAARRRGG